MPFTIILGLLGLLGLAVVFGFTYKVRGWKTAFVISGVAAVVLAMLYVAMVYAITADM